MLELLKDISANLIADLVAFVAGSVFYSDNLPFLST
jgi:hypothetical protein